MLGYGAISSQIENKFIHAPNPTYEYSITNYQLPTTNYILKSAIAPFVIAAMALSVALGK